MFGPPRHITGPFYIIVSNYFDSNIVYFESDDHHVIVDTGTGMYVEGLDRALRNVGTSLDDITDIILTHSHIDHVGGIVKMPAFDGRTYLHKDEADRINSGDMTLTLAETFGVELPPFRISTPVRDGDVLDFGDVQLRVVHTPGHSAGSSCFYEERQRVMITGDTMFAGGSFGRVDFPTGDPRQLVESLKRLSEIEFDFALPGHMSPVTGDGTNAALHSYRMAKSMFML